MSRVRAAKDSQPVSKARLPGHPKGLVFLAFAETWERFSFFGMKALLVLYMISQLLLPGHIDNIVGFAGFRALLEHLFGPLSVPALASAIFGLYGSAIYLTPILGGLLADRWLGRLRTVVLGALLMALGHFLMAFEQPFLLALLCMVLGVGCFKGNIASQVGALYAADDQRRADGFQIFFVGINVGAMIAPLICGTLGENVGWHYGFGAAGVGMLVGLVIYLSGLKYLPPDPPREALVKSARVRLTTREIAVMALLIGLLPIFAVGLVGNQQIGNAYLVWARAHADRMVLGHTLPVTWLLTFQGVMTVTSLSLSVGFWRLWARWRPEPDELGKIIIGLLFLAAAPLSLALGTAHARGGLVAGGWLIAFAALNELGFANVLPVALALYARAAPPAFGSTIVGIYYLQLVGASALAGWLGGKLDTMSPVHFWGLHAAAAAASAGAVFLVRLVCRGLLAPVAPPTSSTTVQG